MKNKYAKWSKKRILIASLTLLIIIVSSIISATKGGDFDVYIDAAQKLQKGQNIYTPPFIKGLQYYYSVFFACILMPFSSFIFSVEFLWLLLSYFLLYRTWNLIESYFHIPQISKRKYSLWIFLTLVYAFQFISYNISMIQITIFLLWGCMESLRLIHHKKEIAGGLLLGVCINIKLMPILLLPYLFYRGYFKSILFTLMAFVVLLFLPALFIGVDYNNFLLTEWWKVINPQNAEHLFEIDSTGTQSLVALLPVYLMPTEALLPYKRNFANLNPQTIIWIIHIVRVLLVALSLFFLKSIPFKKETNKMKVMWEVSYFLLLIPLLMPHQQKYNFLFVLPLISYILYFFISTFQKEKTRSYWVCFVSFIIISLIYTPLYGSDIIGKFLFQLTQHYRVLTICTLLFIPILMYCSPKRHTQLVTS